jgi:Cytochrome C oxidase, cbb3-type, subunit III
VGRLFHWCVMSSFAAALGAVVGCASADRSAAGGAEPALEAQQAPATQVAQASSDSQAAPAADAVPAPAEPPAPAAAAADAVPAPAEEPAPAAAPAAADSQAAPATPAAPAAGGDKPLYTVDGNHVDKNTMNGWRTWRAMACERCHGANQEGLVGPSLVQDLKTQTKEEFVNCVMDGRPDKGMPNFGGVQSVVDNIDNLYVFLKGRSDGAIPTGHLKEIE